MSTSRNSLIEKIIENSIPEPNSGCWIWLRTGTPKGYGMISFEGVRTYAHRASFKADTGTDPGDLLVCHSCDHPWCVNPDHLFLGTQRDNLQDMKDKGRGVGNRITPGHLRPRAKINPDLVREIRTSKEGTVSLARRLGVNRQTILRVRTGKSYSSIT